MNESYHTMVGEQNKDQAESINVTLYLSGAGSKEDRLAAAEKMQRLNDLKDEMMGKLNGE